MDGTHTTKQVFHVFDKSPGVIIFVVLLTKNIHEYDSWPHFVGFGFYKRQVGVVDGAQTSGLEDWKTRFVPETKLDFTVLMLLS